MDVLLAEKIKFELVVIRRLTIVRSVASDDPSTANGQQ